MTITFLPRFAGERAPFVVDQVRVDNVSGPSVEYGFFENGAVDAWGSPAAIKAACFTYALGLLQFERLGAGRAFPGTQFLYGGRREVR
jgi:hypothetical protein